MQVTCPEGVYLPALGRPVDTGETVDLPDEVAMSLIEQGWDVPRVGGPTKAELIEQAEQVGAEVRKTWTVDRILAAIEAHAAPELAETNPATADEQED